VKVFSCLVCGIYDWAATSDKCTIEPVSKGLLVDCIDKDQKHLFMVHEQFNDIFETLGINDATGR
jgi:hypothetical protein